MVHSSFRKTCSSFIDADGSGSAVGTAGVFSIGASSEVLASIGIATIGTSLGTFVVASIAVGMGLVGGTLGAAVAC